MNKFTIESTSRCNLSCIMCPRLKGNNEFVDMKLSTYIEISKYFNFINNISLDGWGEPLLNTELLNMIKIAKDNNIFVGFTSNGTLLDSRISERLIDLRLDYINFSIDGMDNIYNLIRINSNFKRVIDNIKNLASIKNKKKSDKPKISFSFVAMINNFHDLLNIIELSKECGIESINIKNLNVITKREDEENSLITNKNENITKEFKNILELSTEKAKINNIQLDFHFDNTLKPRICMANPLTNIFFSYNGDVSPCCNLGHNTERIFEGKIQHVNKVVFGNILKENLFVILNKSDFINFKNDFERGSFPKICQTCYLLYGR